MSFDIVALPLYALHFLFYMSFYQNTRFEKSSKQTNMYEENTEQHADIIRKEDSILSSSSAMADSFFSSLESNLKQLSRLFPYDLFQKRKPLVLKKKVQIENIRDESSRFMAFIHENAHDGKLPDGTIKTYSLCKDNSCRIIAAFFSHADGSDINVDDISILRDFIRRRLVATSHATPNDLIVIAAITFDDDCQPLLSPPIVLCTPTSYNLWDFQLPQATFSTDAVQFLLHALPGSPNAYADRLADLINHWPKTIYITKDALRQKIALHPSIPDAFFDHWLNTLFARGGYAKDDRGYIYPPNTDLPDGHGAKRVKHYA
jgi:hypothetical protein